MNFQSNYFSKIHFVNEKWKIFCKKHKLTNDSENPKYISQFLRENQTKYSEDQEKMALKNITNNLPGKKQKISNNYTNHNSMDFSTFLLKEREKINQRNEINTFHKDTKLSSIVYVKLHKIDLEKKPERKKELSKIECPMKNRRPKHELKKIKGQEKTHFVSLKSTKIQKNYILKNLKTRHKNYKVKINVKSRNTDSIQEIHNQIDSKQCLPKNEKLNKIIQIDQRKMCSNLIVNNVKRNDNPDNIKFNPENQFLRRGRPRDPPQWAQYDQRNKALRYQAAVVQNLFTPSDWKSFFNNLKTKKVFSKQ